MQRGCRCAATILAVFALATLSSAEITWRKLVGGVKGKWTATATFPVLGGQSPVYKIANRAFERRAKAAMSDFKEEMRLENQGGIAYRCFLEFRIDLKFDHPNLVSALARTEIFTGGAHPNHLAEPMNFGLAKDSARSLTLSDLLAPGVDPAMLFAEFVDPRIRAEKLRRGAGEDYDADPNLQGLWVLGRESITWVFPHYAVGSYAEGEYDVQIPWAQLRSRLDLSGPLAPIFKPGSKTRPPTKQRPPVTFAVPTRVMELLMNRAIRAFVGGSR